jgi:hypothetical protein
VSERTVGRMLSQLEALGRVERVASFLTRARGIKGKGKLRRPYARRKPKGYEAQAPGELVQLDTLVVGLGPRRGWCSSRRWAWGAALPRAWGSGFMAEFEAGCACLGVQLFPPQSQAERSRGADAADLP